MPFKFNPFTGNFDQTGSGGGGASYIDGEEATYNDLSLSSTTAPLNSAWLVRNSSGIWPFNKPGGIYIRTATLGVSRDADYTYAGTMPDVFSDAVLTIYDEASTTRTGQFNLGSVTAGQNRVLTWPDGNGTIARTETFAAPPAIGNTTPSTGAFTTLSAAPTSGSALTLTGGTVTASAPLLSGTQTWNDAAVTFRALLVNVTNTNSASASLLMDLQTGGTSQFSVRRDGVVNAALQYNIAGVTVLSRGAGFNLLGASCIVGWGGTGFNIASTDLTVERDAADIMAQRRTTNAQTFRLYSTFSSTTSFERLNLIAQTGGSFIIGTEKGSGGGTARALQFVIDGVNMLELQAGGSILANRSIATTGGYGITSDLHFTLQAATGQLRWGSTSSVPMLKRSSTTLQVRLANDSAFAPLECAGLTLNGDLTASTRNIVTDTTTGTKIGTGTTQLLGFWNATPVAQQSSTGTNATGFTANGPGNTVHADSTFTGNVGATAYSISDIVKHLKTIGLIAS
jgi:hypothetical protein